MRVWLGGWSDGRGVLSGEAGCLRVQAVRMQPVLGVLLEAHVGGRRVRASCLPQAGRAGRREQHSLGIYLGWDGPLDQVGPPCSRVREQHAGSQAGAKREPMGPC